VLHVVYFEIPSKFISYPGSSFSSTFQDLKLSLPGLSRAWKIQGKKSRTFQDAWEPYEELTETNCHMRLCCSKQLLNDVIIICLRDKEGIYINYIEKFTE